MNQAWRPLRDRESGLLPDDTLHEGVPPHLEGLLREWVYAGLAGGNAVYVALRVRFPTKHEEPLIAALATRTRPDIELLTVIDAILALGGPWPKPAHLADQMKQQLATLLNEGRSVYFLTADGRSLHRRTSAVSADAYERTRMAAAANVTAGSAADHIGNAWRALYGLPPDPPNAYSQAIKAVEAAAHAIIEPDKALATLGTMIRQLSNHQDQYKLAIVGREGTGDIGPLISMIRLLWQGQTSRHGGQRATRLEEFPEAEMAVHLATTLVHWFATGAVRRASGEVAGQAIEEPASARDMNRPRRRRHPARNDAQPSPGRVTNT